MVVCQPEEMPRFNRFYLSHSFMDHRQQHLEPLVCMKGMGFIGRHDDYLAFFEQERLLFYGYLYFAVDDSCDGVERCRMF